MTCVLCEAEGCINKENDECILMSIDIGMQGTCLSYDDGTEDEEDENE